MRNFLLGVVLATTFAANAQTAAPSHLKYVVIFSRHGVRAPSKASEALNPYSSQPWPQWSVPPEHLTDHGAHQMQLVGTFDRAYYAAKSLFSATGCDDATRLFVYTDSNQRTIETGRSLAQGIFPGCHVEVHSKPLEKPDPLFHPEFSTNQKQQAVESVRAQIRQMGGDGMMDSLTVKFHPQLQALDRVLQGCPIDPARPCPAPKVPIETPLFDIDSKIKAGKDEKLLTFKGPLATGSSLAEDMELEYAEGMPLSQVGWGNVDATSLRTLMQLHQAATNAEQRAPVVARVQAARLLQTMEASLQQAVEGKPVSGALGNPADSMLLLVGHDTNLNNLAGLLRTHWVIDGREDDTPPGGALVFELWQSAKGYQVKAYYSAATLDQVRNLAPLTLATPPERVPLYLPACSNKTNACDWPQFQAAIKAAISDK